MQVQALADTLRQIDSTSQRARVVALLAHLFHEAGLREAASMVYLLQGRLGPPYAALDFGLDERRVSVAIATAAEVDIATIRASDRELGDLGDVATRALPEGGGLTVGEAYQRLQEVAGTSGPGSTPQKVDRLAALLRQAGGAAAGYLVRIVLGRLRVQVGDATVMDALSVAACGTTALRPAIERAYRYCSDLGFVAQTLLTNQRSGSGGEALARIQPTPGRPVLSALAERLPDAAAIVGKLGTALVEPKYDGLRLQIHKDGERVWLFTRRLENVTAAFPEITQAARRQIAAQQATVDGEAVSYDPATGRLLPFQETMRRRRKRRVEEVAQRQPMRYYAFDLLMLDGVELISHPQRERSARLRAVLHEGAQADGQTLHVTPQREIGNPHELQRYFDRVVRAGMEGVVVKRPDAPYAAGSRGFDWVKLKREYQTALADSFDLVVVGYDRGRGKRAKLGIGSVLCATYDPERDRFRTVARLGSGLSDADWIELRQRLDASRTETRPMRVESRIAPDVWVEPREVLEVIAGQITRSPLHTAGSRDTAEAASCPVYGYALRFPRMVAFRFDRRPEDATTETEVQELYGLQQHLAPASSLSSRAARSSRSRGTLSSVPRRAAARQEAYDVHPTLHGPTRNI